MVGLEDRRRDLSADERFVEGLFLNDVVRSRHLAYEMKHCCLGI